MRNCIAVILGGGRGERLRPLTTNRAKPAVPFAGMYRLIDIPISNCLHAGIDQIYCLTQYQSASLNRHVAQTYRFDAFSRGHVTTLAAEQTQQGNQGSDWYHGTADAVRKQLHRLEVPEDGDVIILSGDQVYLMDLDDFVRRHRATEADLTVAATRVSRQDATRFGVMHTDKNGRITEFAEKPKDDPTLDRFVVPDAIGDLTHLGSMGIYIFKMRALTRLLEEDQRDDFGKHILPSALDKMNLVAYPFSGFWEDVGTIEGYHRVNLHLTNAVPNFNLFNERFPMYTRPRFLPPVKIGDAVVQRALVCDGAIIGDGAIVRESVVGIRTIIGPRCHLDRVVSNGAGAFDFHTGGAGHPLPLGIGEGSVLRNVIIDRDARIGRGVKLVNERGIADFEDDHIVVRDGVIVVGRQAVVPDGYTF